MNKVIPEILLVDKPSGVTSFGLLGMLRREFGKRKMGHAGTLDPLATGLMIVGVEAGTKKLKDYVGLDKEYEAEILIGESRTTGDMAGEVVTSCVVEALDTSNVQEVLVGMTDVLRLPVSAYSAMKRGGVPMYVYAYKAERDGSKIPAVPIRDMEVFETECKGVKCDGGTCVVSVRFRVGSGTYIRSLAEELGKRLGYPAVLYSLRRTKIGDFDVKNALVMNTKALGR